MAAARARMKDRIAKIEARALAERQARRSPEKPTEER